MGKKRKNVPTLQDLLDRPICYYCEKDFEDLNYLVDHMKAKHYKCDKCGRRLTTAGGLGVHMSQVHKEKLEKVANALPDREKPDIEIFGMEGFPKQLLAAHHQRLTAEYFKREAEIRKATGNPPPGAPAAPVNPQKKETSEEMKKRLAEFKAKKAAEKAAATNGAGSGTDTPPVTGEAMDINSDQHNQPVQPKQEPTSSQHDVFDPSEDFIRLNSADMSSPATTAAAAYSKLTPSAGPAMSSTAFQPMYPSSATYMPSRGPNPATAGGPFSFKPSTPGYAGSPPPPFAPSQVAPSLSVVPASSQVAPSLSVVPASGHRQNSLPSAPGLPQRPAFDSPNISKEDMARMHIPPGVPSSQPMHYSTGQMPQAPYGSAGVPYPQYGVANSPYGAPYPPSGPPGVQYGTSHSPNGMPAGTWYPPNQGQSSSYIGDQVDELIQSVTGERPLSMPQPIKQEPEHAPTPDRIKHEPERSPTPEPISSIELARREAEQSRPSKPDPAIRFEIPRKADPVHFSTPEPISSAEMAAHDAAQGITRGYKRVSSATPEPISRTELAQREAKTESAAIASTKPSKKSKYSKDNVKMLWSDKVLSPEEKRAKKYYVSRPKPTETIIDQTGEDGQEVTGAIDDVYEQ